MQTHIITNREIFVSDLNNGSNLFYAGVISIIITLRVTDDAHLLYVCNIFVVVFWRDYQSSCL